MKNLFLTFLLISPLLFFTGCEKEEDESCTGSNSGDLIVGRWEGNTRYMYYPNGEFLSCTNFCNSTSALCEFETCIIANYNCDGTGSWEAEGATETGFTWSYDPQTELMTTISPAGAFSCSVTTINSNQLICRYDDMFVIDENGNQIDFFSVTVETRVN